MNARSKATYLVPASQRTAYNATSRSAQNRMQSRKARYIRQSSVRRHELDSCPLSCIVCRFAFFELFDATSKRLIEAGEEGVDVLFQYRSEIAVC